MIVKVVKLLDQTPLHCTTAYQLIIFDFDGTLANSLPFFASVYNELAQRYRFKALEWQDIESLRYASPKQAMDYIGLPMWKLPFVSRDFIARMQRQTHQITLFEQIHESLIYLAGMGVHLAIVSSNSKNNVANILGTELMGLFEYVYCGMSIFGKTTHLKKLLKKTRISARHAIYIGDQATDAEAAARAGIDFGAVTWGYGSIESLRCYPIAVELTKMTDIQRLASPLIG